MDGKIYLLEILFGYIKMFTGFIVMFYPFDYGSPFDEVITFLGILIVITSGIKVEFKHDFSSVVKPN